MPCENSTFATPIRLACRANVDAAPPATHPMTRTLHALAATLILGLAAAAPASARTHSGGAGGAPDPGPPGSLHHPRRRLRPRRRHEPVRRARLRRARLERGRHPRPLLHR